MDRALGPPTFGGQKEKRGLAKALEKEQERVS